MSVNILGVDDVLIEYISKDNSSLEHNDERNEFIKDKFSYPKRSIYFIMKCIHY
jgi:hypothetical protein